jgi:hypothetical protein
MKANEAPEKIYLDEDESWHLTNPNGDSVEYVRKDAFIEKALVYLNEKFYFNNMFYGIVSTDFNAMEEMFEDFRNYIEGE